MGTDVFHCAHEMAYGFRSIGYGFLPNAFTTDRELVNAIIANDSDASREAAWKAFVMHYKNLIYSIAVGGFRFRDHDADDVFQAVCFKLVSALRTWEGNGKLSTFVATVTKHACIDKYRRLTRRQEESLDVDLLGVNHPLSKERSPEEIAEPYDGLVPSVRVQGGPMTLARRLL